VEPAEDELVVECELEDLGHLKAPVWDGGGQC